MIGQAIQKYGKENFTFQIIKECPEEELAKLEEYYINYYNSISPNGYNIIKYDEGNSQVFANYNIETFNEIINDIKNSDLSFQEIAIKYNLDLSMIYYINRGSYHTLPNTNYPLRPVQDLSKKNHYCIDCGKEVSKGATRCLECSHKIQYKCEHPDRDTLKELIYNNSFRAIGEQYGVSDKAIVKWCKKFNLPHRKQDIKLYSKEEWQKI